MEQTPGTPANQPTLFEKPYDAVGDIFEPPLPLPQIITRHAKGELFPGLAASPADPTDVPLPSPGDAIVTTGSADSEGDFSATRIASVKAFEQAGITEISLDELPTAAVGLRYWLGKRSARRADSRVAELKKEAQSHSIWGSRALQGDMYKTRRPTGVREDYRSRKKGKLVAHRGVAIAEKTALEYGDNYAQIDPKTGKSKRRDRNGALDHLEPGLRRSIPKAEKEWAKLKHEIDHEKEEVMHGSRRKARSGFRKQSNVKTLKDAEEKQKTKQAELRKLELAYDLKPVRKAARKAYRMDIGHAWTKETDKELGDRTAFYRDMGISLRRSADEKKPVPMTRRLNIPRPGRVRDTMARARAGMLVNRFIYNLERDKVNEAEKPRKTMRAWGTGYQSGMFKQRRSWNDYLKARADLGSISRHRDLKQAQRRFAERHREE